MTGGRRLFAVEVALLAWLLMCCGPWAVSPARANTITPSVEVGVGHDDNIKLEKNPRGDFFYFVRPQLTLQAGQPDDRLNIQGRAEYIWYGRYDSESRLQEASLLVNWHHAFSQTWYMDASNIWSSTRDLAELDEFGGLTQVRRGTARRDRNTTSLRTTTLLGPGSQAFVGGSVSNIYNNDSAFEDIAYYKAEAGLIYRFLPRWRGEVHVEYIKDDWQKSDDVNRYNADVVLAHMLGPTAEAYVGASAGAVRSDTQDNLAKAAREYDIYSVWAGYRDQVTPEFGYDFSAGASYVDADSRFNGAAGNLYPTAKASITYRQPLHVLRAYAEMKLGEYDNLGQNSGLTQTQRFGVSWQWDLAQHWQFMAQADYIHDDYKQTRIARGVTAQGNVDSMRLGASLSYRISRYWKISLDYRYLSRDTEFHTDDVTQNRIMMIVSAEWPQRW